MINKVITMQSIVMKVGFTLLIVLAWLPKLGYSSDAISPPKLGEDYKMVNLSQPLKPNRSGKVIVQEFFSYQCEHCYKLNPAFLQWKKQQHSDVEIIQVPVLFNRAMKAQALLFYSLQSMKLYDKVSPDLFKAIQQKGKALDSEETIIPFLHDNNGINQAAFKKAYHSLDVTRQAERANRLVADIRLQAIPAILVNGQYLTDPNMAGGSENMLRVTDYLIKLARQNK